MSRSEDPMAKKPVDELENTKVFSLHDEKG